MRTRTKTKTKTKTKTSKRRYGIGRLLGGSLIVVLILGSLGWVYRSNWITGSLQVVLAQSGKIDHIIKVQAIFANEEYPLQAPASGKLELIGKDGQRFRRGEPVANILPEGVAPGTTASQGAVQVTAPIGGLFFQKIDGLESLITPQSLLTMDLAKVLEQKGNAQPSKTAAQAGTPLGKIVNNLSATEAFVELKPTADLSVGKTIKFNLSGESQSAKILRRSDTPQGLVVRFNQYIEGSTSQRSQELSWISKPSVSGIIIPKSALWTKGEEQGVYVVLEGIIQFRKIKILDENDTSVCVEDLPQSIPEGIPVVKNPRSGIEGLTSNVKIPS